MASYDLVERLNNTFRQIELELQALQQALSDCRLLAGRVFELPAIGKMPSTIRWPLFRWCSIGKTATARPAPLQPSVYPAAIGKPQQQGRRTPAGRYLPAGYRRGQQDLLARIQHINALKATFEKIVTVDSGLPPPPVLSGYTVICRG